MDPPDETPADFACPSVQISRRRSTAFVKFYHPNSGGGSRLRRSPRMGIRHWLRPRPFPDEAASLLPGSLAATRTGLTPASDDELTAQDQPPARSTSCLLGARQRLIAPTAVLRQRHSAGLVNVKWALGWQFYNGVAAEPFGVDGKDSY